jgi:SpoVK/Ycf46/Vps4 family AAA+-type ATPase
MQAELNTLIQAQYPLIYLMTSEEERAEREIYAIAQQGITRKLYVWTLTQGMVEHGQTKAVQHGTASPQMAIEWAVRQKDPGIYVFKDLHPFKDSADVTRWLRDAVASFKGSDKTIILMSPVQQIPIELETEIVVLDFDLPTLAELDRVLTAQLAQTSQRTIAREDRERLLTAALGLTKDEAEKVFRKAYIQRHRLTGEEVDIVLAEKKQLIRRNGILEFLTNDQTMMEVGGLGELKRWLTQRSDAFSERARDYGLPQPKGMLILGIPGCGKSLIAKTTAEMWGLPLLRLDMGRVYDGSTVGRSEANLRSAIKTAESISPCVLLIDELEKAFSGAGGSADSDAGTSSRIFGSFLTWMQEKTSPVFVMATANRVERLPSEFLRKGRFDEIFFVDLPTLAEREAVFRIHIEKRQREVERFDCEELAKVAEGFSGAEIEQALIAAMYDAFAQDREFSQLDIIAAIKATMPLSRTMNEQVAALRDWARQRARPAASSVADYQRMEF